MEFFKRPQCQNLELFFAQNLPTDEEIEVYTTVAEESEMVPLSKLNMLQVAAALDMSDTVLGYFLRHHTVNSYGKHAKLKTLPAAVVLYNHHTTEEGKSNQGLFLRLLISWGRITTFIALLEGCRDNWTVDNILEAAQVMIAREDWDFLERLLDMSTTIELVTNASPASKAKFHELFSSLQKQEGAEYIYQ